MLENKRFVYLVGWGVVLEVSLWGSEPYLGVSRGGQNLTLVMGRVSFWVVRKPNSVTR